MINKQIKRFNPKYRLSIFQTTRKLLSQFSLFRNLVYISTSNFCYTELLWFALKNTIKYALFGVSREGVESFSYFFITKRYSVFLRLCLLWRRWLRSWDTIDLKSFAAAHNKLKLVRMFKVLIESIESMNQFWDELI